MEQKYQLNLFRNDPGIYSEFENFFKLNIFFNWFAVNDTHWREYNKTSNGAS